MDSRQEIRSLKKALRVLTVMNQLGDATVSQIAKAVGVPRTTSYRMLETLTSEGYLEKQADSDYYRITSLVQHLASGFQDENLLIEIATPKIFALGEKFGWPITLATPRGADMVVRLTTNYQTTLTIERYMVGYSVPMLHTTSGYCHLAFCPDVEREELLTLAKMSDDPRQAMAKNEENMNVLLEKVRDRGYCKIEFPQYREGNVGVPILVGSRPLGGITMRYIKTAMRGTQKIENIYIPMLKELAADITKTYRANFSANKFEAIQPLTH